MTGYADAGLFSYKREMQQYCSQDYARDIEVGSHLKPRFKGLCSLILYA
jgi:hypothetical protein